MSTTKPKGTPDLRKNNSVRIMRELISGEAISRAELARRLELSASTVGRVVRDLEKLGLVQEVGNGAPTGGRTPKLVRFCSETGFVLGIDISPSSLGIDILDLSGRIIVSQRTPFTSRDEEVIPSVVEALTDLLKQTGISLQKVLCVGVAVPGVADQERGTVSLAPNLGWIEERPFLAELTRQLGDGVDVVLENDVNAGAYAEYKERGGTCQSIVFIRLDSGLGAGIIMNDKIWRGKSNFAGELGFCIIGPEYFGGDYGHRGCLEWHCAGQEIVRAAREAYAKRGVVPTQQMSAASVHEALREIYHLAEQGDQIAWQVVDETAKFLATAIVSTCCLLDPDLVVIGGWAVTNGGLLLKLIREYVNSVMPRPQAIEQTQFEEHTVTRGISLMALERAQSNLLARLHDAV